MTTTTEELFITLSIDDCIEITEKMKKLGVKSFGFSHLHVEFKDEKPQELKLPTIKPKNLEEIKKQAEDFESEIYKNLDEKISIPQLTTTV